MPAACSGEIPPLARSRYIPRAPNFIPNTGTAQLATKRRRQHGRQPCLRLEPSVQRVRTISKTEADPTWRVGEVSESVGKFLKPRQPFSLRPTRSLVFLLFLVSMFEVWGKGFVLLFSAMMTMCRCEGWCNRFCTTTLLHPPFSPSTASDR
jgi:hypothetical protein